MNNSKAILEYEIIDIRNIIKCSTRMFLFEAVKKSPWPLSIWQPAVQPTMT